jgi:apolipoprotein D and lipocalin family protein
MTAVSPFDVQRYQGTWYEVARLDHSFERDMRDVTAHYALQTDGSVQVLNRGFDMKKNDWREAIGKAKFIGDTQRASLKVSFFGPFYGGYHVIALDPAYRWSMVVGPDRDYLWILSRSNTLDPLVKAQLRTQALALGLPFERLIWVEHQR